MDFNLTENNKIILYSLILTAFFFLFIMPQIENCYNDDKRMLRERLENIINKPIYPIDDAKCSRSCCINSGWPYPKELLDKDIPEKELKDYVPNNFTCNYGKNINSGCLCLKKGDMDYLTYKAGNLRRD